MTDKVKKKILGLAIPEADPGATLVTQVAVGVYSDMTVRDSNGDAVGIFDPNTGYVIMTAEGTPFSAGSSLIKPNWAYLNPAISYGEMTDPRDGQVYKTVQIGNQTWMAENLNYEMEGSYCYDDDPENAKKYGRLYTWDAAMKAAPEGWHLPSRAEFETLFAAVGGQDVAGTVLKSLSGWYDDGIGTDAYGFSALPAGYRNYYGDFDSAVDFANFWSATEDLSNVAYSMDLYCYDDRAILINYSKINARSVRCLRDSRL